MHGVATDTSVWRAADGSPLAFDIAVVNYNTDYYLHTLLRSIRQTVPGPALGTVHVWDNGSVDCSRALLDAFAVDVPWLCVHGSSTNIQHGPAIDTLLRHHCTAAWVLLLDADTEIRRNFVAALPTIAGPPPAFIGQIYPLMPHLYAYLAHLLVHRPSYEHLPPFRHDGAPGVDFFRTIQDRQIPYQRFRWSDFIDHAGQAALRGVYERGETAHEFYRFAAREAQAAPTADCRLQRERRMKAEVRSFLARRDMPRAAGRAGPATARPTVQAPGRRGSRSTGGMRTVARRMARAMTEGHDAIRLGRARRIGLVQKSEEIAALLKLLRHLRPRFVLEIGTAHGGTFYLWTRVATADATLISVDLPPWERDDPGERHKVSMLRRFARRRQTLHLHRADSHRPDVRDSVVAQLSGHALDLLFIDGDHTYRGARLDFEWYSRLVRPGGIVAIHDIHPHTQGWGGDVPTLWAEIRDRHPHSELIANAQQDGFGIGVLRW